MSKKSSNFAVHFACERERMYKETRKTQGDLGKTRK